MSEPKAKAQSSPKPTKKRSAGRAKKVTKPATKVVHEGPHLLTASTSESAKFVVYLHPDDHRALALARVEDGIPANTRIRAMIAQYRADSRFRAKVDQLAQSAKEKTIKE